MAANRTGGVKILTSHFDLNMPALWTLPIMPRRHEVLWILSNAVGLPNTAVGDDLRARSLALRGTDPGALRKTDPVSR